MENKTMEGFNYISRPDRRRCRIVEIAVGKGMKMAPVAPRAERAEPGLCAVAALMPANSKSNYEGQ
jgi:hypothetical protein